MYVEIFLYFCTEGIARHHFLSISGPLHMSDTNDFNPEESNDINAADESQQTAADSHAGDDFAADDDHSGNGETAPSAQRTHSAIRPFVSNESVSRYRLQGMFQNWFLEYASYVILERAVPNINDGLKPVQRRILHAMKTLDDGRFNKVANIVGNTMQYHPHGDRSINDALVQLGQKNLLIDTQGNWGNILTGASAAAGRYIEARLSLFAMDVLYSPRVTDWTLSYDGRKKEPVTLPAKFPILLMQGAEGIAVGLSSMILPHNFNEILDAATAYLKGEEFELLPDFSTGGMIDVSRYNDGRRKGSVRIRAKIEKVDNRTLAITELPFGKTNETLIDSILKAFEKGQIKLRKIEDFTAETPRILIHLQPGTSSDKAIDALYAFTACEVSISPNCCVIDNRKPVFLGVSDVLKHSADRTREILRRELEIQLEDVREHWHFASLERYFIEKRIYKDSEYEQARDIDTAVAHIDRRLDPLKPSLLRPITRDDILKLLEIRMKSILKFNLLEAEKVIKGYEDTMDELRDKLNHITDVTIEWFRQLKEKYGEKYPRRTIIRSFDSIKAASVAETNEKLYIDRDEGFIGTSLKKAEPLFACSELDDIIIFYKDGRYMVTRVKEKMPVGKGVLHVARFKRDDERTIYNVIYQNGRGGVYYMKRFAVTGVTRDREYTLGQKGVENTRVVWFTANPNGEADVVKVTLKPKHRLKVLQFDVDFSKLKPKGRSAMGNIVTRNEVHRFSLKEKGLSTLGGLKVWFDPDVLRLNYDGRGVLLGEFSGDDRILVILKNGEYYTSTFEASNHYEDNILRIEKYAPSKVFTAVLKDADNDNYVYIKRFAFEPTPKRQRYLGDNPDSVLLALTSERGARFSVSLLPPETDRGPIEVDVETFIGVKSVKAKGKRLTTYDVDTVTELEPDPAYAAQQPEPDEIPDEKPENDEPAEAEKSNDEVRDELTGQQRLFEEDDV